MLKFWDTLFFQLSNHTSVLLRTLNTRCGPPCPPTLTAFWVLVIITTAVTPTKSVESPALGNLLSSNNLLHYCLGATQLTQTTDGSSAMCLSVLCSRGGRPCSRGGRLCSRGGRPCSREGRPCSSGERQCSRDWGHKNRNSGKPFSERHRCLHNFKKSLNNIFHDLGSFHFFVNLTISETYVTETNNLTKTS